MPLVPVPSVDEAAPVPLVAVVAPVPVVPLPVPLVAPVPVAPERAPPVKAPPVRAPVAAACDGVLGTGFDCAACIICYCETGWLCDGAMML